MPWIYRRGARGTPDKPHGWCGRGIMRDMDNIQDQIRELQTSVRRQRFAIVALASALTGIAFVGAVSPAGDATFDTITCKAWRVVDKDGKGRIRAATLPDGSAFMLWNDKDGKTRIRAGTDPNGTADVAWLGKDEKLRIVAGTSPDGDAGVVWKDKDGKIRIGASTAPNGTAAVAWVDKDEKVRIIAGTSHDGTVALPTKDVR